MREASGLWLGGGGGQGRVGGGAARKSEGDWGLFLGRGVSRQSWLVVVQCGRAARGPRGEEPAPVVTWGQMTSGGDAPDPGTAAGSTSHPLRRGPGAAAPGGRSGRSPRTKDLRAQRAGSRRGDRAAGPPRRSRGRTGPIAAQPRPAQRVSRASGESGPGASAVSCFGSRCWE
jgi:hypothetical protein